MKTTIRMMVTGAVLATAILAMGCSPALRGRSDLGFSDPYLMAPRSSGPEVGSPASPAEPPQERQQTARTEPAPESDKTKVKAHEMDRMVDACRNSIRVTR
jgi:hypothetical protein